jgi:hypothetical protein
VTAPPVRPRVVDAAFWCWIGAAILLVIFGLLVASAGAPNPLFYHSAGVVLAVAGVAIGWLAFLTRQGGNRFRRAALAVTFVVAGLVMAFTVFTRGLVWLAILGLLLAAATLITRPPAQEWFDAAQQGGGGD